MTDTREQKTLLILFAAGLIIRLVYYLEYRTLLEFLYPTVDALYHHLTAKAIAAGGLVSSEPFFRAPFYNYFLGAIYYLSGDSIPIARLIQLFLGAFTAPLAYLIARNVFDRRTGMITATLVLLTSDLVYFDGELLLESSVVLMVLLVMWAMIKFRDSGSRMWIVAAGLFLGLAAINRPNTLILALIAMWMVFRFRRERTTPRWQSLGLLIISFVIPIALVVGHNATRNTPAWAIATQGGINFFIGNNPDADGVSAIMPGKLGYAWQYADIKHLAESETGKALSPSEVSSFYYRRALDFILDNPFTWLKLEVKKAYLLLSGNDISNNRNLPYFKSQTVMLRLLPIGMGVLAPLGLIGIWLARRRSGPSAALSMFVIGYGLSFVAFFVNSRFRLPLLPILAVFAAYAIVALWDRRRDKSAGSIVVPAVIVVGLTLLLNFNLYRMDFDNRQQAHFSRGNLLLDSGKVDEAISEYHRALSSAPPLQQVNLNLGLAFLKLGQLDSAWHYFLVEDSLFDGSAEALNNLAYMYRQTKQFPEAVIAADAALAQKPYLPEARLNLWYALRESGKSDSALTLIIAYEKTQRLNNSESFIAAVVESDLHRFPESEARLRNLLASLEQKNVPTYSEASNLSRKSDVLAPALFESRVVYNLGFVLGSEGKVDSAVVYLARAVTLDPKSSEAWTNLGSAYFATRNFSEAITAFEQALALDDVTEIVTFNLALSYLAQADTLAARSYLDRCLQIHPGFAPATALQKALALPRK